MTLSDLLFMFQSNQQNKKDDWRDSWNADEDEDEDEKDEFDFWNWRG